MHQDLVERSGVVPAFIRADPGVENQFIARTLKPGVDPSPGVHHVLGWF
jgi:hypothetical protein